VLAGSTPAFLLSSQLMQQCCVDVDATVVMRQLLNSSQHGMAWKAYTWACKTARCMQGRFCSIIDGVLHQGVGVVSKLPSPSLKVSSTDNTVSAARTNKKSRKGCHAEGGPCLATCEAQCGNPTSTQANGCKNIVTRLLVELPIWAMGQGPRL
jgi:hypothetical protein